MPSQSDWPDLFQTGNFFEGRHWIRSYRESSIVGPALKLMFLVTSVLLFYQVVIWTKSDTCPSAMAEAKKPSFPKLQTDVVQVSRIFSLFVQKRIPALTRYVLCMRMRICHLKIQAPSSTFIKYLISPGESTKSRKSLVSIWLAMAVPVWKSKRHHSSNS